MPSKKNNEGAKQTHTRMLQCALQIIRDEGIDRLSMDRLAEKSAMSKGAVMYHFPSKKKLLSELIALYAQHMQLMLERAESRLQGTAQETLVPAYVDWYRAFERANSEWSTVGLSLLSQQVRTPEVLAPMRLWYDRLFARLDNLPPPLRTKALMQVLALEGLFYLHKFALDRLSPEQLSSLFEEMEKTFPPRPLKKEAGRDISSSLEEEPLINPLC